MPLPEAKPTPDKANIYEQFSNIQASDLTRSQLDIIRDPLFLNSESEDVLRRILLIGQATDQLSVSGPIPRTGQIVQQTFNEANEGDLITIFKPNIGEVWLMTNASSSHSGGSSGVSIFIADQTSSSSDMVFLGQESSTGVVPFNPSPHTQVYLTSDMFLVGQGYSIDTGETSSFKCGVIRVR
jgi:hypothetical protein|tara:strand:- start:404 stop:952 length:549 start_codon:yes stop_codon:yes gene_type:complete